MLPIANVSDDSLLQQVNGNLDLAAQTRFCNEGHWGERLQSPMRVMNGSARSSGIVTKSPCGCWYMEDGHPWLIHAPCVILASLLSIGFMTSHRCNLGSCIMSSVSWHFFFFPSWSIFTHFPFIRMGCLSHRWRPELKSSSLSAWIPFELILLIHVSPLQQSNSC